MKIAEFSAHMRAMKVHYKGYPLTRYPLPISCVEKRLMHSLAADFNADYENAMKGSQQNINDFVEGQQQTVSQETQKLGKSPTGTQIDDFKNRLAQQRENAKAEANKKLDQIFDQLETVGTAHPECQDLILSSTDKIISFLSDILGKVIDFVNNLVQQIYEWLKDVENKVLSFFTDTTKSVSSFFGSLFVPLRSTSLEPGGLLGGSKGDNSFKWNKKEAKAHSHFIIKFAESQKLIISVEDFDEVKQWNIYLGDKSLVEKGAEYQSSDREVTLSLLSSTVKIVAIAAFSGLVAYAISFRYRVVASIKDGSVEFVFEPT